MLKQPLQRSERSCFASPTKLDAWMKAAELHRPNKYKSKHSTCVCRMTRKECDIHHVTPKVFYIGHVTLPSATYWSCDLKVCYMANIERVARLIHPHKILYTTLKTLVSSSPATSHSLVTTNTSCPQPTRFWAS